jgi:cardiolipin synthase
MSDRQTVQVRLTFADHALSRVAGAPLIEGNHIRLLKDAQENYPAWLDAIRRAKRHIYFETFIFHQDDIGETFAAALIEKAQEGVSVRIVYDWLGCLGNTSWRFWRRLRKAGIQSRCYNPPRLDGPLAWLSRDHRKVFAIDGDVGYISGLCVGKMWVGDPQNGIAPWRDTGIEIRGPAVVEIEHAFREMWAMLGSPIPPEESMESLALGHAGNMKVRIVPSLPATAGMIRTDQFIAALARKRLWLSDAYYAGTTSYVQALRAAAMDNVDVRLLVPNSTDLPLLRPLSRTGYRTLLEAGVRVFEWNGPMMHAKTAVADSLWARVGSTNLNLASWFGNCELDALIEDEAFAVEMESMYLEDLTNSTEVVLDERHKVHLAASHPLQNRKRRGRARRAAAGAVQLGNAIGAALTRRRVLEPVEARLTMLSGVLLLAIAVLCVFYPKIVLYPLLTMMAWIGLGLIYRGYLLYRERKRMGNGDVRRR